MRVVFHQRQPLPGRYFSIESSFAAMRGELPPGVETRIAMAPHPTRGALRPLLNLAAARRHAADVHHVTGDTYYVALGLPAERTILTVHDCGYRARTAGGRRLLLETLWYRAPCARARVVTAVSEFTRSELVAHLGVPPQKVVVVPTCISPRFHRVDRPFAARRPTVLQVGTTANKNLERVVAALAPLPCQLRVVGRLSPEQHRLLRASGLSFSWASDLGERELLDEYARADVVAFTSTYEGFGMPIVEGNTVGRPVVTSAAASMPEVAGRAACLVDPLDVAHMREGFRRVFLDRSYRDRLVADGFVNARRFTAAAVAARYLRLYLSVAAPDGLPDRAGVSCLQT